MLYLDKREFVKSADSFLYYKSDKTCGYDLPNLTGETILSQNKDIIELCKKKGYEVKTLSSLLGLDDSLGLYEIFSYFFEGKLISDLDMLEIIFQGLLNDSSYCYCLKIGVNFCWFKVAGKQFKKLGKMQFSEVLSKFSVGKFMKRLRFNIAKSGINLNKVKFLVWEKEDLGSEFESYILKYDCLKDFFSKIIGLKGLSCETVMRLLSKDILGQVIVNAENFVDCLNDSFTALGVSEKEGVLYSRGVFYKDYSSCRSSIFNSSNCQYGIIIDCEGKKGGNGSPNMGLRELGGLIFCRHEDKLLSLDTFYCDEIILEDTLLKVLQNYSEFKKERRINVFVYGSSDVLMLRNSIMNCCKSRVAKQILGAFNFVDCRQYVINYIKRNEIEYEGKGSLTTLAKAVGVFPVVPKHKPVNDAKTLFNILSKILQDSNSFVI